MKNILTNENKTYVIVKVNDKGEPEGVLTRKQSRYGSSIAVSSFDIYNLSNAIKCNETNILQHELDNFIASKQKYVYKDFKIVEMETKTVITFEKEVIPNNDRERIINNNRELIKMARQWGKQWRKENPDEDSEVWKGRPYGSELVVNPKAQEYFNTNMNELNWEEDKDYNYYAHNDAYNAFVKSINLF